jgi:hypothetical protein
VAAVEKEEIFYIVGEILKTITMEILLTGNYLASMIFAGLKKESLAGVTSHYIIITYPTGTA